MTDESFAQGLIGVTLDGRYRLDAVLGEGGMGSVFRATQLAMDRKVAIKLLKPHLTSDEAALQRFAREARATLKVDSPHAVKILDFGVTPLGDYYMVLEYLDGRTVQRELEIDGPFAPARVAHIARQALSALGAAHDQGLIHRDVKPDNLLLMRAGSDPDFTKILDFGVAKLMQGAASTRSQLALTAAGMVFGTPEFMSPEQACGQELDGRSDLYSLAVTMFTMLTGTTMFEGKTAIEWLTHHARTPAPHLAMVLPELAAYPELDELLQRCLAKHREHRPGTAAEMAARIAALEPTLSRTSATAPRPAPVMRAPLSSATQIHASSYFHALSDTLSAEAVPPNAAQNPAPGVARNAESNAASNVASAPTASVPPAPARSRRGRYRWLTGAAIASVLGGAVGVVIRQSASRGMPLPSEGVHAVAAPASAVDAGPAGRAEPTRPAAPADAAGPEDVTRAAAPADAAVTPSDAAAAPVHDAPPSPTVPVSGDPAVVAHAHVTAPVHNAAAEEHLRKAEEAFRSNDQLKQLAEADLALHADPRSVRARYLVGDALIKSGDLDHGCTYLRAIKRNQLAHDRARAAGCPGD